MCGHVQTSSLLTSGKQPAVYTAAAPCRTSLGGRAALDGDIRVLNADRHGFPLCRTSQGVCRDLVLIEMGPHQTPEKVTCFRDAHGGNTHTSPGCMPMIRGPPVTPPPNTTPCGTPHRHNLACPVRQRLVTMAPLFIPCTSLPRVYSPLAQRRGPCLPGRQSRSIPFTRPSQPLGRLALAPPTQAASPDLVGSPPPDAVNGNGGEAHQRDHSHVQAEFCQGTLAVHGGERAGRPRVSGAVRKGVGVGGLEVDASQLGAGGMVTSVPCPPDPSFSCMHSALLQRACHNRVATPFLGPLPVPLAYVSPALALRRGPFVPAPPPCHPHACTLPFKASTCSLPTPLPRHGGTSLTPQPLPPPLNSPPIPFLPFPSTPLSPQTNPQTR